MPTPITIGFLVKKPAQFDVPLFQYARAHAHRFRLLVLYIHPPEAGSLHDPELQRQSGWDMDLTNGYDWLALPESQPSALGEIIKSEDIRLLITNGYKGVYAPHLAIAKQTGIPLALRIDSVGFGRSGLQNFLRKWVLKRLYAPFRLLLTTGIAGYQFLDALGIAKERQGWFPYCTDNAFFQQPGVSIRQQLGTPADATVFLGVCKFNERENPLELVRAFRAIAREGLYLVMVGDGNLKGGLQAAAGELLDRQVFFPGYVAYSLLPAYYQAADIFVHPAFYEPWGVSVQEAIAGGCAVIYSHKVGSGFDLVKTGKNGYQYRSGDTAGLAEKMQQAMALDPQVVEAINAAVLQTWNYGHVWKQLQEAAEKVLGLPQGM